jgi:hypothetical protein
VNTRRPDLSRTADAHIVAHDGRFARERNGALRTQERLRLLADEGSLRVIR